jgi:hypothetical protein
MTSGASVIQLASGENLVSKMAVKVRGPATVVDHGITAAAAPAPVRHTGCRIVGHVGVTRSVRDWRGRGLVSLGNQHIAVVIAAPTTSGLEGTPKYQHGAVPAPISIAGQDASND